MKLNKHTSFLVSLLCCISLFISITIEANVYADESNTELDGMWTFVGAMVNDELALASKIDISGFVLIEGSLFSLSLSALDEPIIAILSETSKEGVYDIGDGENIVGICAVADDTLIVMLIMDDDISLLFMRDSSNDYSSSTDYNSNSYTESYTSGTYIVGDDIPSGEYVFFSEDGSSGYYAVYEDKYSSDIKENDSFDYNSIMHINNGEKIKINRCYAVPISDAEVDTDGEGMFKIGTHLPAGNYHVRATSDDDGYYCIYSDNEHENIKDNDIFIGDAYFSVSSGEYLVLNRCKIVN